MEGENVNKEQCELSAPQTDDELTEQENTPAIPEILEKIAPEIPHQNAKIKWKIVTIIVGAAFLLCSVIFVVVLSGKSHKIDDLQITNNKLQVKVDELSGKVQEAEPWFEMTAAQQQEAEEAQAEKEAEAAATAAAAKEEAEKVGYDTGITYDQLARTPEDYEGQKVKFMGKVLQVMEDTDTVSIRLAVDDDYDNVLICGYDASIVSSRVLEDDNITIYGTSAGLYTYESTMGASITIPAIAVDKIDQ